MRKAEIFGASREDAVALLAAAPVVHLAGCDEEGRPVLRALHAVVFDGAIWFHGSPVGEKAEAIGRPAVISADEVVASIPSFVFDPERACPATTYYRSAQVHGVLEDVADLQLKARALQALMEKYQPEGGHAPITAEDPRYRLAVKGIGVVRMSLERACGKWKLGQNRKPEEITRVLEYLWRRGEARAVEAVRAANPSAPAPEFLTCPAGARLVCALGRRDVPEACALLADQYWNVGVSRDRLEQALVRSPAWVGARDEDGRLVATGRATGDGAKWAFLFDIVVAPEWRGRGLGRSLVRLLLDHEAVRGARKVLLRTRDAHGLYRKFGFVDREAGGALGSTEMELARG